MTSSLESIGWGREALARGEGARGHLPDSSVARLLVMLWEENRETQQAAVRSLPGGNRDCYYEFNYGYFSESFLRELRSRHSPMPVEAEARYEAVVGVLHDLIDQSTRDIRAMSGMHYSFLSSALYLAVFATCRDALLTTERLRAAPLHVPLCGLMWNLSAVSGTGRLNPQDTIQLMEGAGRALAVMPPDKMPELWAALSHTNETRRLAVMPALSYLSDARSVPYLLELLPMQKPVIAERIVACLGRLGDARAVPLIHDFTRSADWPLRRAGKAAIAAIRRTEKEEPVRTLLRPSRPNTSDLLRSAGRAQHTEPPSEMLHVLPDLPARETRNG